MEQPIILQAATPDVLIQFAPILIVGVIFYLLIFMPMRKRQKKETMIAALRNGDKVITSSGIYGAIAGVKDKTFILKIADQVKIEVTKNSIAGLQGPEGE